jgi:hypothetical protein
MTPEGGDGIHNQHEDTNMNEQQQSAPTPTFNRTLGTLLIDIPPELSDAPGEVVAAKLRETFAKLVADGSIRPEDEERARKKLEATIDGLGSGKPLYVVSAESIMRHLEKMEQSLDDMREGMHALGYQLYHRGEGPHVLRLGEAMGFMFGASALIALAADGIRGATMCDCNAPSETPTDAPPAGES